MRRFEAIQRLQWFVLFFICLALACTMSTGQDSLSFTDPANVSVSREGTNAAGSTSAPQSALVEALKSFSFWFHLRGVYVEPLPVQPSRKDQKLESPQSIQPRGGQGMKTGSPAKPSFIVRLIMYFIRVAILFLVLRVIWLVTQFAGKFLLKSVLSSCVSQPAVPVESTSETSAPGLRRSFPTRELTVKLEKIPCKFLFHPFQRLRLILADPRGILSSEGLLEKERRIVDSDWQILWNSWTPFRWILWILPFLALAQTAWLGYQHLMPLITSVKDLQNGTMPDSRDIQNVLNSFIFVLIPLAQVVAASIFFSLASGLLRRIEDLYLSNLDALLYDCFLSRLPFQSGDTVVLLQALQHYFQEMHASLKRIEKALGNDGDSIEEVR